MPSLMRERIRDRGKRQAKLLAPLVWQASHLVVIAEVRDRQGSAQMQEYSPGAVQAGHEVGRGGQLAPTRPGLTTRRPWAHGDRRSTFHKRDDDDPWVPAPRIVAEACLFVRDAEERTELQMGVDKPLQILTCFSQLTGEVSEALEATRPLGIWLTRIIPSPRSPAV